MIATGWTVLIKSQRSKPYRIALPYTVHLTHKDAINRRDEFRTYNYQARVARVKLEVFL